MEKIVPSGTKVPKSLKLELLLVQGCRERELFSLFLQTQ